MAQDLIIFGAGGHALSVADVALDLGFTIKFFVDPSKGSLSLIGTPIVSELPREMANQQIDIFVAIGDNNLRQNQVLKLKQRSPLFNFPNLIHPRANVSKRTKMGQGSVLFAGSSINIDSVIGDFCIINTNSSVDHSCNLENYSSLAPGVNLGGNVQIGESSFIGIGSTVKHEVRIGGNVLIGAHSYVNSNIEKNVLAFGIPARVVKNRSVGENFFL